MRLDQPLPGLLHEHMPTTLAFLRFPSLSFGPLLCGDSLLFRDSLRLDDPFLDLTEQMRQTLLQRP